MSKKETTRSSRRRKQEKGAASAIDPQRTAGGEVHQIIGGEHEARGWDAEALREYAKM
jgi:ribosome-binding protein aMBF1 (putative translation factor)